MSTGFQQWGLTLAVFIPALGALVIGLLPRRSELLIKWVALLSTLAAFGVGIAILADYDIDDGGM